MCIYIYIYIHSTYIYIYIYIYIYNIHRPSKGDPKRGIRKTTNLSDLNLPKHDFQLFVCRIPLFGSPFRVCHIYIYIYIYIYVMIMYIGATQRDPTPRNQIK